MTVSKRVTLERFRGIVGELPGALHGAAMRGLRAGMRKGVEIVKEEIRATSPYPPIDRGRLIRSVKYKPTGTGTVLFVDAPHAIFMEAGTRPHFPPLKPIFDWVLRKGLADDEDDAYPIARAIQHKIAMYGIKPRHFFRRAMRRIINEVIPGEIKRELRNLARRSQ